MPTTASPPDTMVLGWTTFWIVSSARSPTSDPNVDVLLESVGSSVVDATLAELTSRAPASPPGSTLAVIATSTSAPLAMVPRAHVTVAPGVHVPAAGVAVTEVGSMPAGSGSLSVTPAALDGPSLWTRTFHVIVLPATTDSSPSLVTDRSAAAFAELVNAASLLVPSGSRFGDPTVAWLTTLPPGKLAGTAIVTVTVVVAPARMSPSAHCTLPSAGAEQVPWAGTAVPNVNAAGKASVTVTALAVDGPLFPTVSVYVTGWPAVTSTRSAVLAIDRSDVPVTVVVTLSELSVGSGSVAADDALGGVDGRAEWGVRVEHRVDGDRRGGADGEVAEACTSASRCCTSRGSTTRRRCSRRRARRRSGSWWWPSTDRC